MVYSRFKNLFFKITGSQSKANNKKKNTFVKIALSSCHGLFVAFLESMVETAGPRLTGCVAVVVESANRGTSAYDTALYNAATMYVAQQNKTGGGG